MKNFTLFFFVLSALLISPLANYSKAEEQPEVEIDTFSDEPRFEGEKFLFDKPSPFGRVRVSETPTSYFMYTGARIMCGIPKSSDYAEVIWNSFIGDLTAANIPDQGHVLNIGFGCGHTVSHIAKHDSIGLIDGVEINPVAIETYDKFFDPLFKLNDDPRVNIHVADGMPIIENRILNGENVRYDSIVYTLNMNVIYSIPVYTREYFQKAEELLNENGMIAIWLANINAPFMKIAYNNLSDVFENVQIIVPWYIPTVGLLVASNGDINIPDPSVLDHKRIQDILSYPEERRDTLSNPVFKQYLKEGGIIDFWPKPQILDSQSESDK